MSQSRPRVAIVGGGVIGSACAYYLSRAGCAVTVVEREALGGQTSSVAAGILAPTVEAEHEGPFFTLASASLRLFPELTERLERETGLRVDYQRTGVLNLAYDEEDTRRLEAQAAWQEKQGFSVEWLDRQELRHREPAISPEPRGAVYSNDGQQVAAARLVQAYLAAAARSGARLLGHTSATGLTDAGGRVVGVCTTRETVEADAVLLSGGAWSSACSDWLGIAVPVEPIKGQLLSLRPTPSLVRHVIFGRTSYLAPKADGTVVLGATMERVGHDRRVTADGLHSLLSTLPALVPELAHAEFVSARAGLRPGTPDRLPIIGPVPGREGVWVAAGHFRNGVLLSPITGTVVAQLLLGEQPSLDVSPFALSRFTI